MLRGFKNFLMRGDVVVVAIGLMVALAFSTLIASFTTNLINPLLNRAQGKTSIGLGVQLGQAGNHATLLNFGGFLSALVYFLVFMGVLYLFIVVPYRFISARRGVTVFADPAPAKTCPFCLSGDIPMAATKCKYCGSDLEAAAGK
jgi:large conductance mechanosensitive channel